MSEVLEPRLRDRVIALPGRGGEMAAYEMGPADRPIDLVFSHANGFNARTYRSLLAPLADRWRVLMIDMRGHGRSRLPTETEGRTSWSDLADDLMAALAAEDLTNVILSGHSMGGCASLIAAAGAPERVRGLVLFDPVVMSPDTPQPPPEDMARSPLALGARNRRAVFPSHAAVVEAYRGRGAFKTWPEAALVDYVADGFATRADGEVELTCSGAWEASNFTTADSAGFRAFGASRCPIRVLRAEHGSTCRVDGHIEALTADGRIRIETVPGTSHFLPMERPDLVRETLEAALAG
ncbi:alpha/beta fold hydrolase [Phenylobacterium aquaticum]|uniref:alpha/beta fold hydrolase n=3 Tax=Phenylobacterium aquaticum TaxID=1763816 RepID=UPI0026E9E172|nr:alpha/beta hydrolase [Phenylobacterium aquaticum]